jgi:hypothetical protein
VSLPQKPHRMRKISKVRMHLPRRTCHVIQLYRDVTYAAMTRLTIDQWKILTGQSHTHAGTRASSAESNFDALSTKSTFLNDMVT